MRNILLLIAFLLNVSFALAQGNYTAVTCNSADVQNCVNGTSCVGGSHTVVVGDTVNIPLGTCTWTSGVTLPKGIVIKGAGAGRIIAVDVETTALSLTTGSKTFNNVINDMGATNYLNGVAPPITNGQTLLIQETGFTNNFLKGTVTSFTGTTLVMNITSAGGTCGTIQANTMNSNCKRWLITTAPSTVLINNLTSGAMFTVTEDTSFDTNISGIKFGLGSSNSTFVLNRTSGGKAILIHDNWIELNGNLSSDAIDGATSRGVIWNNSFNASPPASSPTTAIRVKDDGNSTMPNSWITTSTFGTKDAAATAFCPDCLAGQNNMYIETNDFHAFTLSTWDFDSNSRMVSRYNVMDNSGGGSHGADTSSIGLRHFEFYNNVGIFQSYNDGTTANMNWWQFVRGGTFAFHDNVLPTISSQDWGNKSDVVLAQLNLQQPTGPHPCWGRGGTPGQYYYAPRQTGVGNVTGTGSRSGTQSSCGLSPANCNATTFFFGPASTDSFTYVGDPEPIYLWNNTRTNGGANVTLNVGLNNGSGGCTTPDTVTNYVQLNRDYFNNSSAKPTYTPFQYPHPLTVSGGTPTPTFTPASAALGLQPILQPSHPFTVSLQNTGTANYTVTSWSLTNNKYSITGATCGSISSFTFGTPGGSFTLAAGASCTFQVVYFPSVIGQTDSGGLTFTDNTGGGSTSYSFTGTGISPPPPAINIFAGASYGCLVVSTQEGTCIL